jgi:2'-5' RNA ligase
MSPGKAFMHRLFVALDLPPDVVDQVQSICHGLLGARWVDPDNLHLTLRFLGDVSGPQRNDIEAVLAEIDAPAFDFSLAGIGHWQSAGTPKTIWLGVDADPGLTALYRRINREMRRLGLPLDGKAFRPHVTLARARALNPHDLAGYLAAHSLFRSAPITATDFYLYQSRLHPDGPVYSRQARFSLSGAWMETFNEDDFA